MSNVGEWRGLFVGGVVSVCVAVALLGVCAILLGSGMVPERGGEGGVVAGWRFVTGAGGH